MDIWTIPRHDKKIDYPYCLVPTDTGICTYEKNRIKSQLVSSKNYEIFNLTSVLGSDDDFFMYAKKKVPVPVS
jgi:hypothetical protein